MTYTTDKKADGFLNLVIKTPKGDVKLRRGIALDTSNRVERSLLNATIADPEFVVELTGSVHIVTDETSQEDIAFS